jgi:hypothetical protein
MKIKIKYFKNVFEDPLDSFKKFWDLKQYFKKSEYI